MPDIDSRARPPKLFPAAFFGLCPRCGSKTLFDGIARFSDRCGNCGLDYGNYNVGDGPAAFLTMGVGGLIIVLAVLFDIAARPPFWVHAVIWIPVTVALTVFCLRVAKGMLLIIEHRREAHEARGDDSL